jgi:hypothetical protein
MDTLSKLPVNELSSTDLSNVRNSATLRIPGASVWSIVFPLPWSGETSSIHSELSNIISSGSEVAICWILGFFEGRKGGDGVSSRSIYVGGDGRVVAEVVFADTLAFTLRFDFVESESAERRFGGLAVAVSVDE